jgi:hypothetical protein
MDTTLPGNPEGQRAGRTWGIILKFFLKKQAGGCGLDAAGFR